MARGGWQELEAEARRLRQELAVTIARLVRLELQHRRELERARAATATARRRANKYQMRDKYRTDRPPPVQQLRNLAETAAADWPVSGDPNIIGEHEVPPVRCGGCNAQIPWAIIKGWRN